MKVEKVFATIKEDKNSPVHAQLQEAIELSKGKGVGYDLLLSTIKNYCGEPILSVSVSVKAKAKAQAQRLRLLSLKGKNPLSGVPNSKTLAKALAAAQKQRLRILSIKITEEAGKVELIKLSEINIDKKLFQNRDESFSAESVTRIIDAVDNGTFQWEVLDPILLWERPRDKKLFVLSGHSRTESFIALSDRKEVYKGQKFDRIPAKIIKGIAQSEAVKIALDSNTLATKETDLERAKYYRGLRQKGVSAQDVEAYIRKNEGKNAKLISNLSYLSPTGFISDAIRQFSKGEVTSKTNLQIISDWTGEAMKRNPEFTLSHENEISRWLLEGGYGTKTSQFSNKLKFLDRLHKAKVKKYEFGVFKANEPLNVKNLVSKNHIELAYEQELSTAKDEVFQAEKDLKKKAEEAYEAVKQGKITIEKAEKVVNDYAVKYSAVKSLLNKLASKREMVITSFQAQTALFGVEFNEIVFNKEFKKKLKTLK